MIPCKHCNTLNGLDSTFCKRCGTGLPEDEILASRTKLEAIVVEGVQALAQGRVQEALAISESAVVADPSMVSALSLKASVHERLGQIAEALECAERIVELNPDSELDKIKRNQLRSNLAATALANRPPSRAVATVFAFSFVLILVCGALGAAHFMDRPQTEAKLVQAPPIVNPYAPAGALPGSGKLDPQLAPETNPNANPQTNPATDQAQTTPQQSAQTQQQETEKPQDQEKEQPDPAPKHFTTGPTLPSATKPDPEVTPLSVTLPSGANSNGNALSGGAKSTPPAGGQNKGQDPDPTVETPKSSTTAPSTLAAPDPGFIEITPHRDADAPTRIGNSGSASVGGEEVRGTSKMYSKMGTDSFLIGNYSRAAESYQKALDSGADPITTNERIAQSYSSLGKKKEAVSAYNKAIEACSTALSSGKGNTSRIRALRDACETAVRQLQGN